MPTEVPLRIRVPEGFFDLEGILMLPDGIEDPAPAVVVCHPHPLYGGDMHNEVVLTLCRALLERGMAALRFNFRGAGRSGGDHGGGYEEREDVFAALDLLRTRHETVDPARLGLAGYSFGAAVALNAAPAAGVRALCAVSPPPQMLDFSAQFGVELPVLLIAGDNDPIAPAARVEQLPAAIGPSARASIVAGADHFWWGHMVELSDLAGDFFAQALTPGLSPRS
jgi:alpha/beta superfamily hydrolase